MEKIKQITPYIIIGILSFILVLGFFKYQSLEKMIDISNKFHIISLEQERKYRQEEKERTEQIERDYQLKLQDLDKKYRLVVWRLSEEKKKEKFKIINNFKEDPNYLKEEWKNAYGFQYFEKSPNASSDTVN